MKRLKVLYTLKYGGIVQRVSIGKVVPPTYFMGDLEFVRDVGRMVRNSNN